MTNASLTRRTFIHRVGVWTALAASSGLALQACGGGDDAVGDDKPSAATVKCDDVSALDQTQQQQRAALGYIEVSMHEGKTCANCVQYVAAVDANACGTCKVMPGPINPGGYCNVWVQKPA